jgi:hypothetical protein
VNSALTWDLREQLRRGVRIALPDPEAAARGTSGVTDDVIARRLRELDGRTDAASIEEIAMLGRLREKRRLRGT